MAEDDYLSKLTYTATNSILVEAPMCSSKGMKEKTYKTTCVSIANNYLK
jgi:hypothetical protein